MDMNGFRLWIAEENNFALFDAAAGKETVDAINGMLRVLHSNEHSGLTIKTRQLLGAKVIEKLKHLAN